MSMRIGSICTWSGGGGRLVCGMSSFTAWVITGRVMMNMIRSTNMTSINGVVLISIMGSSSPPLPTLIAMANTSSSLSRLTALSALGVRSTGFSDEPDLLNARALRSENHAAHELVTRLLVGAHVHFRLRLQHGRCLQAFQQRRCIRHQGLAPVDLAILVHRDVDVFRRCLGRLVAHLRQLD